MKDIVQNKKTRILNNILVFLLIIFQSLIFHFSIVLTHISHKNMKTVFEILI